MRPTQAFLICLIISSLFAVTALWAHDSATVHAALTWTRGCATFEVMAPR
jgi:hypothetical protein